MRTNEQRIASMHERAMRIREEDKEKRIRMMQIGGFALAIAAVIALTVQVAHITQLSVQGTVPSGMIASIFSNSKELGFIVVAILSFALGAAATIFCFYLKKYYGRDS